MHEIIRGDARDLPLTDGSVDLVVTSPPYWRKREYGADGQIGQEATPQDYAEAIADCLDECRRVLAGHGSVFLNIGDTYHRKTLSSIPGRVQGELAGRGWYVRNVVTWVKPDGKPDPAADRLTPRTERIIHLTANRDYYYDLTGYEAEYGEKRDVWRFRTTSGGDFSHLAPFPAELPRRAIVAACPREVCVECGGPRERRLERTDRLDTSRPQAERAMELYESSDLTREHIRAVQAVGISDVGKAKLTQSGTGRNDDRVMELAAVAKDVLGGYTREFTFAEKETVGWTECDCGGGHRPGSVLDPFAGSCTTRLAARELERRSYMVDIDPQPREE